MHKHFKSVRKLSQSIKDRYINLLICYKTHVRFPTSQHIFKKEKLKREMKKASIFLTTAEMIWKKKTDKHNYIKKSIYLARQFNC